jgi:nicotinate phosphoribosyltransferase
VCRNASAWPLSELLGEVNRELDRLCSLGFAPDELDYLGRLR